MSFPDRVERALSPEVVTSGEIEGMHTTATWLIDTYGEENTVNGMPAIVTSVGHRCDIGGHSYTAKLARFTATKDNEPAFEEPFVAYDSDPDAEVQTPNAHAVRFAKLAGGMSIIVDAGNPDQVEPNDPATVEHVKSILAGIQTRVKSIDNDRAREKQEKQSERKRRLKKVFTWLGLAGAGVGVITLVTTLVVKNIPDDFDDTDVEMPENPAHINLGTQNSGSPNISRTYLGDNSAAEAVPGIHGEEDESATNDGFLEKDNKLRVVTLVTDKPEDGKNCATIPAELGINDAIEASTTLIDPESLEDRSKQLTVVATIGQVQVCFLGPELNEDDDPKVFIRIVPRESITADQTQTAD